MSFTADIKTELCKIQIKRDCCLRAECYGAWLFSKCFTIKEAAFTTESGPAARRMLELAASGPGVSAQLSYAVSRRRRPAYRVSLPEEQERVRKKLSELDALKNDVNAYIEAVNEELEEAEGSISELEGQMEELRARIETAGKELLEAERSEQEQYKDMKLRIQYMYEKGDTLFLEMLFDSATPAEFLNRAEYISRISEYDRTMLAAYQETKELIVRRREELADAYASLETVTDQAEAKRASLSELQAAKEAELSGLNAEISENEHLMADYDEAMKEELDEFLALEEAIRQREAEALAASEEESRRAEQETAASTEPFEETESLTEPEEGGEETSEGGDRGQRGRVRRNNDGQGSHRGSHKAARGFGRVHLAGSLLQPDFFRIRGQRRSADRREQRNLKQSPRD